MAEPPPIAGVRRHRVRARGVDFLVTEAGDDDGLPVVLLHGWPQHHFAFRDLLRDPPAGMWLLAPDLPGYGWSGPPPHSWSKDEVARDVVALLHRLGVGPCVLVGHDWGAWIGYQIVLAEPGRVAGLLAASVPHPWVARRRTVVHAWRFPHMPLNATVGVPLHRHTAFLKHVIFRFGTFTPGSMDARLVERYAERFRDPTRARAARDTYRTFLVREAPRALLRPDERVATVPIRAMRGARDPVVGALMDCRDAKASDYTAEVVPGAGHFLLDERPDVVRARVLELAAAVSAARGSHPGGSREPPRAGRGPH